MGSLQHGPCLALRRLQPHFVFRPQCQVVFLTLQQSIDRVHAGRGSAPVLKAFLRQQPAAQAVRFRLARSARQSQGFHQHRVDSHFAAETHKTVGRAFNVQTLRAVHQMFADGAHQLRRLIAAPHAVQHHGGLGLVRHRQPVHALREAGQHVVRVLPIGIQPRRVAQVHQIERLQPIRRIVQAGLVFRTVSFVFLYVLMRLIHQIFHHLPHVDSLSQHPVRLPSGTAPQQLPRHATGHVRAPFHSPEPAERAVRTLQFAQRPGELPTQVRLAVHVEQLPQSLHAPRPGFGIGHPRRFFEHDAGQVFLRGQRAFCRLAALAPPSLHRRLHLRILPGQLRRQSGSIVGCGQRLHIVRARSQGRRQSLHGIPQRIGRVFHRQTAMVCVAVIALEQAFQTNHRVPLVRHHERPCLRQPFLVFQYRKIALFAVGITSAREEHPASRKRHRSVGFINKRSHRVGIRANRHLPGFLPKDLLRGGVEHFHRHRAGQRCFRQIE